MKYVIVGIAIIIIFRRGLFKGLRYMICAHFSALLWAVSFALVFSLIGAYLDMSLTLFGTVTGMLYGIYRSTKKRM